MSYVTDIRRALYHQGFNLGRRA